MATPLAALAGGRDPPEPARGALPGVEAALRLRSEAVRSGGACPGLASGGLPVGDCHPLGTSTDRPPVQHIRKSVNNNLDLEFARIQMRAILISSRHLYAH